MKKPSITDLIKRFQLVELPIEGGLFFQSYLSHENIQTDCLPERYQSERPISTAIYYLLTSEADSFSAMHILKTDEIYHVYLGDPVEMLLLYPSGENKVIHLGRDVLKGQELQFVVPRGVWQGSRLVTGGEYALLGTTMAPGYSDDDVEFGTFAELSLKFPDRKKMIKNLTRM